MAGVEAQFLYCLDGPKAGGGFWIHALVEDGDVVVLETMRSEWVRPASLPIWERARERHYYQVHLADHSLRVVLQPTESP